ncbi:MAG: hypothetical protein WA807_04150 [Steroidobacteraceae bacterium]
MTGATAVDPVTATQKLLFEIRVDDVDQFLRGHDTRIVPGRARIEHVLANVILNDLGDEAIQRTPTRGGLLKNAGALMIGLDRALERIDLTAQAFEAIQKFGLFFCNVAHWPKILRGAAALS